MKNKLYNFFALVGFVTTFIIACSSYVDMDDMDDQSSGTVTLENDYGKYQIESFVNANVSTIVALNTETGVMKTYFFTSNSWEENFNFSLTLTH